MLIFSLFAPFTPDFEAFVIDIFDPNGQNLRFRGYMFRMTFFPKGLEIAWTFILTHKPDMKEFEALPRGQNFHLLGIVKPPSRLDKSLLGC